MAEKFNETQLSNQAPPMQQIRGSDLKVGRGYRLEYLERVMTVYGESLVATIDFNGSRCKLFLPKIFAAKLTDSDILAIVKKPHNLKVTERVLNSYKYQLEPLPE